MSLDFKEITLNSEKAINSYIKHWNCENAEFSFAHMFIWGSDGKIQYAEKDGFLFIKLDFPGEVPFFWPPFPLDKSYDYSIAVKMACEYMRGIGVVPYFRSICTPFKEMIEEQCPDMEFHEKRNNFDYLYLSEKMITLSGKKLHGKRNHINKFLKTYPDFVYEELTKEHYEECMELYDEWCTDHKEVTITQFDERSSVERALLNLDELGLTGGIIRIDGVLKAFTVGEQVLPTMSQIHIEKAAKDIDGLYPLINQMYAQAHCSETEFINREEDMGLEGLRKAKLSYRPERMVEKYDVRLKCKAEKENEVLKEMSISAAK